MIQERERNEVIQSVLDYPMDDVVESYARRAHISVRVAKEQERELKRYLALCILHPDREYGMAGVVDEAWHHFILCTRDYAAFCLEVAGRFIHHVPTSGSEAGEEEPAPSYALTLSDYEATFGEAPPPEVWTVWGGGGSVAANCNTPNAACGPGSDR